MRPTKPIRCAPAVRIPHRKPARICWRCRITDLRVTCFRDPRIEQLRSIQFPEKLIPLMISNALEDKPLPVYGDGQQVRDWLYVEDHCRAIFAVLEKGEPGEIYNIGGNCSLPNLEVVRRILRATNKPEALITRVVDRPGHDRRYALTNRKLTRQTGWRPQIDFDSGLDATIEWYRCNKEWVQRVKSGEYRHFYELNYANRSQ